MSSNDKTHVYLVTLDGEIQKGIYDKVILIVDSIIDALLLYKHIVGAATIIATLGCYLTKKSMDMLTKSNSVVFFVNEYDKNRCEYFHKIRSIVKHLMPVPIINADTIYESKHGVDFHLDFAVGKAIIDSTRILTGRNINSTVKIEQYNNMEFVDFIMQKACE